MDLLNGLERRFGRFALGNLSLYLVVGQVLVFTFALFGRPDVVGQVALQPAAVLEGEVWRLVTFLFVPPVGPGPLSLTGAVFLAFGWYMFWMMGGALEGYWGAFRYNLFLGLGWLLTVAAAFVFPGSWATNAFLAGTVFLAFAHLNPDFELLLFFILPLKIKWLALVAWIGYGISFAVGDAPARLAVLASVGNFLVFFGGDLFGRARAARRRSAHQARAAAAEASDEPRHRCVVCGKTERSHPQEDFRYGDDDRCYCSAHRGGKGA